MKHLTTGVNCATLTPMEDDGAACIPLLEAHCRWLLAAGCDGIVLLGTTGEANSFSIDERKGILENLLEIGIDAQRLIIGTGCCAIDDTVTLTKHALRCGVARVLVLPPFYYKDVQDAGLIEAFSRTIEAVGDASVRVYLYQIPQLTGIAFSPLVIEELLDRYDVVAGIKDSSGDLERILALCERFKDRMDVLAGSERFLIPALCAGAAGCVTATANAHPEMIAELYAHRDAADADARQERVAAERTAFERYPMIPGLKEHAARRTGDARWRNLRPPLVPLRGDM